MVVDDVEQDQPAGGDPRDRPHEGSSFRFVPREASRPRTAIVR